MPVEPPSVPGYRVLRPLGQGAMGAVFLVAPTENPRIRQALKVMQGTNAQRRVRLQREGEILARLRHPNLVTVHASGEVDGQPYLVMDYLEGQDLEAVLRERGRLPWREACAIARDLARGLAHAHALGVLHRDIKPANIILGAGGPILIDFGLARAEDLAQLTRTGATPGTPLFFSPEHFDNRRIRPESDVYSLAVTLYLLLCERTPFVVEHAMGLLGQMMNTRPEPPSAWTPELPRALDRLLLQALAPEPEDRPEAARFAERLDALVHGGGGARRRGPWAAALAGVLLLSVAAAGIQTWRAREARRTEDAARAETARRRAQLEETLRGGEEPAALLQLAQLSGRAELSGADPEPILSELCQHPDSLLAEAARVLLARRLVRREPGRALELLRAGVREELAEDPRARARPLHALARRDLAQLSAAMQAPQAHELRAELRGRLIDQAHAGLRARPLDVAATSWSLRALSCVPASSDPAGPRLARTTFDQVRTLLELADGPGTKAEHDEQALAGLALLEGLAASGLSLSDRDLAATILGHVKPISVELTSSWTPPRSARLFLALVRLDQRVQSGPMAYLDPRDLAGEDLAARYLLLRRATYAARDAAARAAAQRRLERFVSRPESERLGPVSRAHALAESFMGRFDHPDAARALEEAARLDPTSPNVHYARARAHFSRGEQAAAARAADTAYVRASQAGFLQFGSTRSSWLVILQDAIRFHLAAGQGERAAELEAELAAVLSAESYEAFRSTLDAWR